MTPISVLHVCSNRWNSAIAEYQVSAAKALAGKRQLFVVLRGSPLAKRLTEAGFTTIEFDHFRPTQLLAMHRLIKANNTTHVITYGGSESFLVQVCRWFTPFKYFRFFGDAARFERKRAVSLSKQMTTLIVPSLRLAHYFRQKFPGRSITEVTLGCDDKRFFLKPLPERQPRPTLLIFGRFDPIKGHVHAMRVFKSLLREELTAGMPRPQLWLIGLSANLSRVDLANAAEELSLKLDEDVFVREEKVGDVPALMRSVHVGWVSSLGSEVICRVAQEFLLCGTRVFVSGVGSLDECIFTGAGTSYKYPTLDDAMITARLRDCLTQAWKEDYAAREERARTAKAKFGFAAMRMHLEKALQLDP